MNIMPYPAKGGTVDAFTPVEFILDVERTQTNAYTLKAGENVTVGEVLGEVTATGELRACAAANGDGSEVPVALAMHPVDATTAAKSASFMVNGFVNENALTLGAGLTLLGVKQALSARGIHMRSTGSKG